MFLRRLLLILTSLTLIISCGGNAQNLSKNDKAPEFTLEDHQGNSYSLSDYEGKAPVVLYFYPKADTPGCTEQACNLRDDFSKFKEAGIKVFGISTDDKKDIEDFIKKYELNFTLLSDADQKVSEKYGVLNNLGFSNRITFIVDKEGKIYHIMRDVDVSTHASEVYDIASNLL